jgi:hypothetical protein
MMRLLTVPVLSDARVMRGSPRVNGCRSFLLLLAYACCEGWGLFASSAAAVEAAAALADSSSAANAVNTSIRSKGQFIEAGGVVLAASNNAG